MKIKSMIEEENIYNIARYNDKTTGTHLFIHDGFEKEKKNDYSNIVLVTLMLKRGFFNSNFQAMVDSASELVNEYEKNNTMGL